MAAYFREIGEAAFLDDDELRGRRYEWSPPKPGRFGKLKIRFICPLEDGPRRFFIEPVLNAWTGNRSEPRFLERACSHGHKLLKTLGGLTQPQEEGFRIFQALFRHREAGRNSINREFAAIQEFVDADPLRDKPELLLPGFPENVGLPWKEGCRLQAAELLRDAVKSAEIRKRLGALRPPKHPADVIRLYEGLLHDAGEPPLETQEEPSFAVALDELPGRGTIDYLFTDGIYRRTSLNLGHVAEKVRMSLIHGVDSNQEFLRAIKDEQSSHVFKKIRRTLEKLNQRQFDKWLTKQREHGFVELLEGGYRLNQADRNAVRDRARAIYCCLLWQSYMEMARCYGALMLLVWLHFCFQFDPSTVERLLFRQMHFPQMYLAGLPLAFLRRGQFRWIVERLSRNWRNEVFAAEQYDHLTDLLGLYGTLCRARREADRRTKAHAKLTAASTNSDEQLSDAEDVREIPRNSDLEFFQQLPELRSNFCDNCNNRLGLKAFRKVSEEESLYAIEVYCRNCDQSYCFRSTFAKLQEIAEAADGVSGSEQVHLG